MPPKKRIQKQDILAAAAQVIRQKQTPTVRSIAAQLGCSTQPLYSEFGSQEKLFEALPEYLRQTYLAAHCTSYKDYGRVFLRFAAEEKELFQYLYLRRREPGQTLLEDPNRELTLQLLASNLEMSGEQAAEMHRRMQYYCYGLGVMIATGYRDMSAEEIDRELTDIFVILLRHYKQVPDEATLAYWLERSRHLIG